MDGLEEEYRIWVISWALAVGVIYERIIKQEIRYRTSLKLFWNYQLYFRYAVNGLLGYFRDRGSDDPRSSSDLVMRRIVFILSRSFTSRASKNIKPVSRQR